MRILFFLQPGANSRSIFLDMIRGFARAGHETILWELQPIWTMYERHGDRREALMREVSSIVASLIKSNRCGLSIGMWANGIFSLANGRRDGRPATFFDLIDEPHLMFWLDAPQWAHGGDARQLFGTGILGGSRVHHLINNEGTAREMRDVLGFSNVHALAYGIDEGSFRPRGAEREFDVVFALGPGDPTPSELMLREIESSEPDVEAIRAERARSVRGRLHEIARAGEAPAGIGVVELMEALLESQVRERDRPVLDRLDEIGRAHEEMGAARSWMIQRPQVYVAVSAALRQVESWERAFVISYLSRHLRCAVFGSGDLGAWGYRGTAIGEVAYEDQCLAYSRGRLGLNVMRQQDDVGVNLKPLEISASGTACLMRERPGIGEVLESGREIATFRTPRGALEAARALLDDESARRAMGEAARSRVLREHTWTARAGQILSSLAPGA